METQKSPEHPEAPRADRLASEVKDDGTLVEMVYDPVRRETSFVVSQRGEWQFAQSIDRPGRTRTVPFSPQNNLIRHGALLLPSVPEEYGSEQDLIGEIQGYIHRYVDLTPAFERLASYYVLMSWVYDAFNELPYLRVRGDFGTAKTRFLLVVGALCYKPFFASGASTVSPIFHTLDAFRGTLVIDEGDFRFSDEKADIIKLLNNGNVRGVPVLRTMVNDRREYNPRAFQVFGPKLWRREASTTIPLLRAGSLPRKWVATGSVTTCQSICRRNMPMKRSSCVTNCCFIGCAISIA